MNLKLNKKKVSNATGGPLKVIFFSPIDLKKKKKNAGLFHWEYVMGRRRVVQSYDKSN